MGCSSPLAAAAGGLLVDLPCPHSVEGIEADYYNGENVRDGDSTVFCHQ